MNNRNLARNILLDIDKLKSGESLIIEDLSKKYKDVPIQEIITIVSRLSGTYYIKIEGKFAHDCSTLDRYSKIIGLDREGCEAVDIIKNDKIWRKVEEKLSDYEEFSIITAISLAKKIVDKLLTDMSKEN